MNDLERQESDCLDGCSQLGQIHGFKHQGFRFKSQKSRHNLWNIHYVHVDTFQLMESLLDPDHQQDFLFYNTTLLMKHFFVIPQKLRIGSSIFSSCGLWSFGAVVGGARA
jgi:hypothetical protein